MINLDDHPIAVVIQVLLAHSSFGGKFGLKFGIYQSTSQLGKGHRKHEAVMAVHLMDGDLNSCIQSQSSTYTQLETPVRGLI